MGRIYVGGQLNGFANWSTYRRMEWEMTSVLHSKPETAGVLQNRNCRTVVPQPGRTLPTQLSVGRDGFRGLYGSEIEHFEFHGFRIQHKEPAHKRFSVARNQFDGFGRLDGTDDARKRR